MSRRLTQVVRIGYGAVQLCLPHRYASVVGVTPTADAVLVMRVLGARHLAQGALLVWHPTPGWRRVGSWVDWLHAASLLPLSRVAAPQDAPLAAADAVAAVAFAVGTPRWWRGRTSRRRHPVRGSEPDPPVGRISRKARVSVSSLSLPVLLLVFAAAAAAIWVAGIQLSDQTDVLSTRLHLGSALGGLILLAVATNLPEIAIVASASLTGNVSVAVGNILGGIAIQTVVLVVLDVFGVRGERPLTHRAASLVLVLEGTLVIAVLAVAVAGSQLPSGLSRFRLAPASVLIAVLWVAGLFLLQRASHSLPWTDSGEAPGNQEKPKGHSQQKKEQDAAARGISTSKSAAVFGAAALVTLVAGVVLERSGDAISGHIGLSGVLFGATVLAAATSLPEVSTGLTSVRNEDYQLAVSDIFGGNAFLPVLFLVATLLSGKAVLPQAQATDIYLTALGILLTLVYAVGLVFRPQRRIARMGVDSIAVLVLYLLGVAGLFAVAHH